MPDNNEVTIRVSADNKDLRLDRFLTSCFPDKTRSFFTKKIKENKVLVNEESVKPGYILNENDNISIFFDPPSHLLKATPVDLDIIFEDTDLIVLNKPAGITVHPGKGTKDDTLVNALIAHTDKLAKINFSDRPGIVHRLDKNTSGLLVVAKNEKTYLSLRSQFDTKEINRTYWVLVWGVPQKEQDTIETFLNRSKKDPTKITVAKEGKKAITHFKVLKKWNYFSLLECTLETGRTHQIRSHMNYYGHPVFADPEYSGREKQLKRVPENIRKRVRHILSKTPHQFLHAKKLEFIHPSKQKKLSFESELPEILKAVLEKITVMPF